MRAVEGLDGKLMAVMQAMELTIEGSNRISLTITCKEQEMNSIPANLELRMNWSAPLHSQGFC
jgi:hypothetical protein